MSTGTPATAFLTRAKVAFTPVEYDYDPGAERVGIQAAQAIGLPPEKLLKTLMVEVDGRAACVVIPADRTLSMKKAAAAFGGKSASMMPPDKAERATGYRVGGISPFGQRRSVPTAFEASAIEGGEVAINAGKRGFLLLLDPKAAVAALECKTADLCADQA